MNVYHPVRRRPSQNAMARFFAWLGDMFDSEPRQNTLRLIDAPITFETPALFDGFPFTVKLRLHWAVWGPATDVMLRNVVHERREAFRWIVSDRVRKVAREHAPHLPKEAEARLAENLMKIEAAEGDIRVECMPYVWLGASPQIVKQQQDAWLRRLGNEDRHETIKLDVVRMRQLRTLWRTFLSEAMDDWMTTYAVRLAEKPGNVADVLNEMLKYRQDEMERLLALVNKVMAGHQVTNVYDFVVQNETVLRHTLQMMGIPVPDPQPNSPFNGISSS